MRMDVREWGKDISGRNWRKSKCKDFKRMHIVGAANRTVRVSNGMKDTDTALTSYPSYQRLKELLRMRMWIRENEQIESDLAGGFLCRYYHCRSFLRCPSVQCPVPSCCNGADQLRKRKQILACHFGAG